jgi:hypothetical protein
MNYKFSLIVESELDDVVYKQDCLTLEGVQEELLRKAEHAIKKYEDEKEMEAQMEMDRLAEDEAEYKEIEI